MTNRGQQLNFLTSPEPSAGRVISVSLHTEMQQSYLEYAMSVIVGRALPDVRDGLKPVHRRIIFAMHELGLVPERPYRKSARVVGDVLGKYHPHGDQSVYDALVRLVQDFSSRYPLLGGHGNFGSVDNDPAAAMRYTECRLAPIGNEVLLSDINEAVIDFAPNFDGSQMEPTVLPAQLPMLLLNGASGIAVGMATNIPPHNLAEVVDGMIALIDRPDLEDEKLFELIPAPDFPTGGIIVENTGVRELYSTGRGSITVRGVHSLETVIGKNKRSRQAIIVTELPFQVNKSAWIEKIAELVNHGKIEGIDDLRDESDRTGMRVVLELKKDVTADGVLEQLYRQTALQSNFGGSMLALCGSMPKQLTLRQLLEEFLAFREETLTRRYRHELQEAQSRLHLVEGLVSAIENLDALISLLRFAATNAIAKTELQAQFNFSVVQAEAILSMPLRRITAMEQSGLQAEMTELKTQIASLEVYLGDRRELLKNIKKELRQLKKKHGDNRRTRLLSLSNGISNGQISPANPDPKLPEITPVEPPQPALIQLTQKGYIKRLEPKSKNGSSSANSSADDIVIADYHTSTDQDLIVLTNSGKAFPVAIADIPKGKPKGTPLIRLLPDSAEPVVSHFVWDRQPEASIVLVTAEAKIKRLSLSELGGISSRGLITIKLGEQDQLFWGGIVSLDQQIAVATSTGRILRMNTDESQVSILGRSAMGTMALRLRNSETLIGVIPLATDLELLLITAQGYAKRLKAQDIRLSSRASIGSQSIMFKNKEDSLAAIAPILPNQAHIHLGISRDDHQSKIGEKIVELELVRIPLEPCNSSGLKIPELEISRLHSVKIYN
ncbi:type IIA topoisomerase (DNA gyrase/topo II, topoisomerase IV), A subunit [Synechococcus sp. PCC 7502]|uniref:DNA gyrase/topoisomerase IV subunit A n=1 Tax=Synechococcus sp. PCC 7502 TaxID=1173263 RepID=UPI00029FDCE6|nr:DNA topoisomerase (ATP-hydrolyzing) [Synechococcus sp. PCC 7502]AFY73326.1 type IIA topoisomerase (DNA gyrase/topo II, topoisomerase IV), A subunit [Synechococcus sp. PCC 7502]